MKRFKIPFYLFLLMVLFNACKKEYSIENSSLTIHTGTWQFNDSLKLFSGNMDSAYIDSSVSTTKVLHLVGTSLDGSQTFHMELYADTFNVGTYKASLFQSTFEYTTTAKTIYQADQLIGEFIVNITSFSNTQITGTFSGTVNDSTNTLKQITLGKFTSTIAHAAISSGVFGDSLGICKPVTVSGAYIPGTQLAGANTVQVQVTVAAVGAYTIFSDTLNGVSFSTSGTFTTTGVQTVILNGTGNPVSAGDQNFIINYGTSQCSFKVSFGVPATGTLGGGGGACTPFVVAGNYQQGITLNVSNTVQLQVTIVAPGTYNITSTSSNGVTFSGSGTFPSTGVQTVILTGIGTPTGQGTQNYSVSFGPSTCSFSINFLPPVTASNDYFPLTLNSNWTYSLAGGTSSDSVHSVVINYSPIFGSTTYNSIAGYNIPSSTASDSFYYRKPGGDYYEYVNYSSYIPFDQQVSGEFIFLKDNVANLTTWVSPNITGTIGGIPVTAFIKMTILAKAVPVTVGTFNFPDVIEVKYEYFVTGNPVALRTDERWFAKNVGEIHDSLGNGTSSNVYDITAFQVF
jgi:hypothetical protein